MLPNKPYCKVSKKCERLLYCTVLNYITRNIFVYLKKCTFVDTVALTTECQNKTLE